MKNFYYNFIIFTPNLPFIVVFAVIASIRAWYKASPNDRRNRKLEAIFTEEFKDNVTEIYNRKLMNFVAILFWIWLFLNIFIL